MSDSSPLRIAGLVRVSTAHQAEHGGSIDDQLLRLQAWTEQQGGVWIAHYGEQDRSGRHLSTSPGFEEMKRDAATDQWDAVVVESCDRFRRKTYDALGAVETLREHGKGLHILDVMNGVDLTSDDNASMAFLLLSFTAEQEGRRFTARGKKGHRTKLARGKWNGGPAPFGYRYGRPELGETDQLVHDETEGPTASLIWRLALDGWPTYRIARELSRRGIRGRKGAVQFGQPTVSNVLRNPVYAGHGHAYDTSERTRINARKDRPKRLTGVLGAPGDWEPVVTTEEWSAVQSLLDARRNSLTARGGRPSRFLFAQGAATCHHCGNSLWTRSDNGTYQCSSRKYGIECPFRPIKRELLDGAVREFVCDDARLLDYEEALRRCVVSSDADTEMVERRIASTVAETDRLEIELQAIAAGTMNPVTMDLFERKQAALADKSILLQDLRAERQRLKDAAPTIEEASATVDALRQAFLDPNADDVDALRDTLRRAFESASVEQLDPRGKRFQIHFQPSEAFMQARRPSNPRPMHVPSAALVGETQVTACQPTIQPDTRTSRAGHCAGSPHAARYTEDIREVGFIH